MKTLKAFVLFLFILSITSCSQKKESSVNLEMIQFETGKNLMAPGLGTLGVIEDGKLFVFYLTETPKWVMDKVSQFYIPEPNHGLMALGMGILGLIDDDILHFYYMGAEGSWQKDEDVFFVLPEKFERISCMRLPWELGFIALEENKGAIDFYYLSEDARWLTDETAQFIIPQGTEDYLMLGSMDVGVVSEGRLLVYFLNEEGDWQTAENLTLKLPQYDAFMAYEPGVFGLLKDNTLTFYALDSENEMWIYDDSMDFHVPEDLE